MTSERRQDPNFGTGRSAWRALTACRAMTAFHISCAPEPEIEIKEAANRGGL